MATAFICHCSADKYFADLLVKILEYHRVEYWYDGSDIELGKKYKDEISQGLKIADYLVVVLSENSLSSKWVPRELGEFLTGKPNGHVIPLLLSPVSVDEVFDGLREYQAVLFYKNMLDGFRVLLSFFDKEFLPLVERRQTKDRRKGERRHDERREALVAQRLRIGMWKYYEKETGRGKFDVFNGEPATLMYIASRFQNPDSELNRYEFIDKSSGEKAIVTQELLLKLLYAALDKMRQYPRIVDVVVIESIATELSGMFDVKIRGRRGSVDRRGNLDRRVSKKR
jgi:hypothetical protein